MALEFLRGLRRFAGRMGGPAGVARDVALMRPGALMGRTAMGRSALAGAGRARGFVSGGAGALGRAADPFMNNYKSLLIRGALGLGAAKVMQDYSEGNFETPLTRGLVDVGAFGLRWGAYSNFARAGTRGIGSALRGVEQSQLALDRKRLSYMVGGPLNAEEVALKLRVGGRGDAASALTRGGGTRVFGGARSTNYNAYGDLASKFEMGGSVDKFMSNLGPLSVAANAGRLANKYGVYPLAWGAKAAANFPVSVVTGRMGYTRAAFNAVRPGAMGSDYRGLMANWMGLAADIGAIRSPIAPLAFTGMAYGAGSAWLERRTPFAPGGSYMSPFETGAAFRPWDWQTSGRPLGVGGRTGPMHNDLFGGIQPGGPSAIRSPDVQEGQMAVAEKMVTFRRM